MNRLPVAERREQLIEAALAVASRDGIDAATVRAVAAEAGVSLGVVHYCFQDKDELLRAMAHAITSANLERSLGELPPEADDPESVIEGVIDALWAGIRESRGPQLLSYELTTSSLRHAELNQVAIEQYRGQWAAAEQVLRPGGAVRARQLVGPARHPRAHGRRGHRRLLARLARRRRRARRPAPGCRASGGSSPRWPSRASLEARHRRDRSRERTVRRGRSPTAPGARASPSRSGSPRRGSSC